MKYEFWLIKINTMVSKDSKNHIQIIDKTTADTIKQAEKLLFERNKINRRINYTIAKSMRWFG